MSTLTKNLKPIEKIALRKQGLATRMREELKKRGMSQSQFAALMNRHRPEVTKWLSGSHNFTVDTLLEIEFKLEISLFNLGEN